MTHGAIPPSPPAPRPPAERPVAALDPWTGELLAARRTADAAEVGAAVVRARQAQPAWGARPLADRLGALERFRRLLFAQRDRIAALVSQESGKPLGEAMVADVAVVLDDAAHLVRRAPRLLAAERRWPRNPAVWRKRILVERVPLGVVAVIAPWNYPFMLGAGHVLPALVAGNAVLLKPSEFAPLSGEALVALLHEAGVPADVMQLLHGDGRTGAALVEAPVDFVCFTGSTAAGAAVARRCGERMIPCSLELGGNDVAIVCDDAPLPHTARGLAWGRMMNAGQSCVAPKRVLATPGIHAALVAALAAEVRALRVGPGVGDATDVGPLIRPGAAAGVRALVADAVAGGAQVVAQASLPRDAGEGVVPPMLLDGVSPGMRLWDEELFGPVLAVRRVASVEEAIVLANAGPYGLSASVWSRDRRRARMIASRLAAGSVALNDVVSAVGVVELPHGGVGRSGHGRLHGAEALLECTRTRAVLDDVLPALRNPWWFGYGAAQREDIGRFTGLIHGRTLGDRLRGLMATLRLLRGYPSGH